MRIVDTKGQLCPAPLIAAKRALKESAAGASFILLTDNKTAFDNLCRFLKDNKAAYNFEFSEGTWSFSITKQEQSGVQQQTENYSTITHFEKGNYIVVISSDKMGEGEDKLGSLLIVNFIKALKDLDKLPSKIIFYNSGVKLVTSGSQAISNLKDLERMGVEIILCATCVDFYSLGKEIAAGTVSNMFSIAEIMASSDKIIKP